MARNAVSRQVLAIQAEGGGFGEIAHLVSGARGRTVYETGDVDAGIWSAGQAQGLIHDVPSVDELIRRIVREAEEIINGRLSRALSQEG